MQTGSRLQFKHLFFLLKNPDLQMGRVLKP